jgi:glycosyltransferase involved in cell wall biosynthesis
MSASYHVVMPRVLMVITSLGLGGAQRQVVDLAIALRDRGWEVSIASLLTGGPLAERVEPHGIRVRGLDMRRGRADPRAVFALRRVVAEERPDVVHSHMIHANLLARLALVGVAVPLINTIHNETEGGPALNLAQRMTKRLPDLTTVVSEASMGVHLARRLVHGTRTVHVANAIDLRPFRHLPPQRRGSDERFEWVALARLEPQKDLGMAIRAAAGLDRSARLTIAGDGPLRGRLQDSIDRLGAGDRILLAGVVSDVPSLLGRAHGLVLSSRWEGMPIALIEGAAAGLPCVATDAGGVAEVVADGRSGFVVPIGDPDAIGAAMAKVMAMPEDDRIAMGEQARNLAARFDVGERVGDWEGVYREVMAR